jgi:hypothetical protein
MIVAAFLCYLVVHFWLYAAVLRHRRLVANEKGIFLYHFVPAAIWVAVLGLLAVFSTGFTFAHVILIGSLHGIYSLTILELWALADGGYSLAIMDCLDFRKDLDQHKIIDELVLLGEAKKQARVADLLGMGLIRTVGNEYELTAAGRFVASMIALVVGLTNASMSH